MLSLNITLYDLNNGPREIMPFDNNKSYLDLEEGKLIIILIYHYEHIIYLSFGIYFNYKNI